VEWAYSTLPEKVSSLLDFPGIQVADEPPADMFERISRRGNWPRGSELLGCYSGVSRTKRQHNSVPIAPDLIFVFRGPVLRCSRGNLPDEVKQVVWHEVAHWLGHDEQEIKELGLSLKFEEIARNPIESEALRAVLERRLPNTLEREQEEDQQPRCLKCYSTAVTCREFDKPFIPPGVWIASPRLVHAKICKCASCGYEWDDEDEG
jgi:predicted Zn-dependent protease with MMP-like domain